MMVKKTWRKRLTAFMSTAKRNSHASPDIVLDYAEPLLYTDIPRYLDLMRVCDALRDAEHQASSLAGRKLARC
jgi:hypothetical protein